MTRTSLLGSIVCTLGSASLLAAPWALSQSAPVSGDLQKVVVTGTLISRADTETPSVVQIITAQELIRSGQTSVAEVLSRLTSNGQGALSTGLAAAFANAGAGVSLRGLTVGLTLVLIDGHRTAPYPLADDAQRQFVDVTSIPFDAVERIEILKDGASATYGSDAVAGVINIILKKNLKGTSLSAELGDSQHGGGRMRKAALSTGFGELATQGFNLFGSVEYKHTEAIKVHQRDDQPWANGDWTGRGGINLTRGVPTIANNRLIATNTPFFYTAGPGGVNNSANFTFLSSACDYTRYMAGQCAVRDMVSNLRPETENLNAVLGFTTTLGPNWQLSLKASAFRRESNNNRGVPATFSAASFPGFTSLVPGKGPQIVNVYGSTLFPANYPGNLTGGVARLYGYIPDVGPANRTRNTALSSRLAADLSGSAMGWDISAGFGASRVSTDVDYGGYINRVTLYNALNRASAKFNPLGGNTQADMETISPAFSNKSVQDLRYIDLVASRQLATLPGGALTAATGLSWVHKQLDAPSALPLQTGLVGSGAAYAFAEETNSAVFGELNAQVLRNLELVAAARYDHYDTYGHSFTPSAKFKWTPSPAMSLRGSFSRGFRAPSAAEAGLAGSLFNFHAVNDPILCPNGNPKTPGNYPTTCSVVPAFVQTTSKDLAPEKSTSYTLGLILQPARNVSATIDYYHIRLRNQINTASGLPGFVPDYVRNAVLPVDRLNADGTTTPTLPPVGTIAYATSGYVNAGGVRTRGVELDLSASHRMGDLGQIKGRLSFNHMISYALESNGVKFELAGTHGPSIVSGNTGNPKNRAQLALGWDAGPLSVNATLNWTSAFTALDPSLEVTDCGDITDLSFRTYFLNTPGQVPAGYCRIPSFATTDLNLLYKVSKQLSLKLSVLNLLDRAPPTDLATAGNAGNLTSYNATLHQAGAVGRYISLGASYAF